MSSPTGRRSASPRSPGRKSTSGARSSRPPTSRSERRIPASLILRSRMNGQHSRRSGRQPVLARNVVATSQPLAAQAGAAAFARGGNAIDAALAAAITLTVVEPTMNGIGGDGFAQVWDGGALHGLNASGRAPRAWSPQRFAGLAEMPRLGWDSVTVPGAVSSWVALSERFGALPFADLFVDAIRHARDGFPVSPVIA